MTPFLINFAVYIVIILPIAFWLYRDSRGRDFSWIAWTFVPFVVFFISHLFLGIFVLFIIVGTYFIFRPKGLLEKCPHCSKSIHPTLFICPFCRKNAKKECLHCHEPVPWEAKECPFCRSRALTDI